MARFRLLIEYEGTRYAGWQYQKNAKTIEGELQKAIQKAFNTTSFQLYGSSRTDAGVHAIEQAAHLDIAISLEPKNILYKINQQLPYDINVLQVDKAPAHFHARRDAVARSYIYVYTRRRTAFGKNLTWWVKDKLDHQAMTKAASKLAGFHDFASYTDEDGDHESTLVELMFCDIYTYGDSIILHVCASHFLWKMVRRIAGTLAEVGRGNIKAQDISLTLQGNNLNLAQYTAPPSGLYLEKVYYEGEEILQGDGAFKLPFSVI